MLDKLDYEKMESNKAAKEKKAQGRDRIDSGVGIDGKDNGGAENAAAGSG